MTDLTRSARALDARASARLDLVRWLAALAVLAGHVRGLFFVDYGTLGARPTLAVAAGYWATSLGHQAVMVFFVLSGFLVGGPVVARRARWSWLPYVTARATRLYLVLAPALVLTALVDRLGRSLANGAVYYHAPLANFAAQAFDTRLGVGTWVGNLFFLQTIVVEPFGSNGPLWSLANEAWYYVLFPCLVVALASGASGRHRIGCGLVATVLAVWLPVGMLMGFGVWLLGVAVFGAPMADLSRRPGLARAAGLVALGLLGGALVVSRRPLPPGVGDGLVGLGAATVVWVVARVRTGGAALTRSPVHTLAGSSYSLYAIHFPLVLALRAALGPDRWRPTSGPVLAGAAIVAGLLLVAAGFAWLTEARTNAVRVRLAAGLGRLMQPRAAIGPPLVATTLRRHD